MPRELPVFKVRLVEEEGRHGFLFEKRFRRQRTRKYFYESDGGLKPSPSVRKSCSGNCHPLRQEKNQHLILVELREYTIAAHESGHMHHAKHTVNAHNHRDGYADVLGEFFRRGDATLREFLGGMYDFRDCILEDTRRGQTLVGRADEFRVVSPENLFPEDGFTHLRDVGDFLEVGTTTTSEWFRKRGPVWKDLEDGVVLRRGLLLDRLKEQTQRHQLSLLEGSSASGKSVLARSLAYELHSEEGMPVYYFRCRPFNAGDLLREVCDATGLVILEDIHLDPTGFQEILTRIRPDWPVRVLFTGRQLPPERSDPNWREFASIPSLPVTAEEAFDDLLSQYAEAQRHRIPDWPVAVRNAIKSVAGNSFWLLAYALKGYADSGGEAAPMACIQRAVQRDLQILEAADPVLGPSFPRILVTLAPLSRHEVLTAASFLVDKRGLDRAALNALYHRREIDRVEREGRTYYGLPHSALAEAYWTHGKQYRHDLQLPDYADFVYDYVTSHVPNPLEATMRAGDTADALVARLDSEKLVPSLIRQERSLLALAVWMDCRAKTEELSDEEWTALIETSGHLLREAQSWTAAYLFFAARSPEDRKLGRHLWRAFDKNMLAGLLEHTDVLGELSLAWRLRAIDDDALVSIVAALNLDILVPRLLDNYTPCEYLHRVHSVQAADSRLPLAFLSPLTIARVAKRLSGADECEWLLECLSTLQCISEGKCYDLINALDVDSLLDAIARPDNAIACRVVATVALYDMEFAKELVRRAQPEWIRESVLGKYILESTKGRLRDDTVP